MDKGWPVVSVVCITYNHENFIAGAIESFLSQETDFPFEIIVHDDASTDSTSRIIEDYCAKYPGRIKHVLQAKNMYSQGVRILELAYSYASAELIAPCEGDDYWNDRQKLQKQFDYLRANPRCGAVFSDANILVQKTGQMIAGHDASRRYAPPVGNVKKFLLKGNPYKSCTVMLRKDAVNGYATHAQKLRSKMDDYVLWLHVASRFDIGYIPEALATYRILENSASHFSSDIGKIRFERSAYRVAIYFNRLMGRILARSSIKASYAYAMFSFFLHSGKPSDSLKYVNCSVEFWVLVISGFRRKFMSMRKLASNEKN